MQIQKYKYTHTKIQHMIKCQKHPTCGIFLKIGLFKDIKNSISMCQTCKYKNTNIQIHKYTNTAYDEAPERPNMWHVFEKRIVQGSKIIFPCAERTNTKIQLQNT